MKRRNFVKIVSAGAAGPLLNLGYGMQKKRPNIIYIIPDQFRADCLGSAGSRFIHTPHLDRLAGEGVRFTRAYTTAPSCTPARSGLLTGLSPWHHGLLGYGVMAKRYPVELPRTMADAGYHTCCFGKNHYDTLENLHGFQEAQLYDRTEKNADDRRDSYHPWFKKNSGGKDPDLLGLGSNDYRGMAYPYEDELHPTYWTGQKAVDFINQYDKPNPFMLKVAFHRPHSPYDPPARFMDMYGDTEVRPVVGDWAKKYEPVSEAPHGFDIWHGKLPAETVQQSRRAYFGSVSFIDEQVGRIIGALKKKNLYDNTLIVFTSDHGDMLGDQNLWRKTYAYEASARIPMIVKPPKDPALGKYAGQSLSQPVELRDLFPTFTDAAGEPIPQGLDGRSLLALLRNREAPWRPFIDLEHATCYAEENNWNGLTDGHVKYVYFATTGEEQLFDLDGDPDELRNLAGLPGHRETLDKWRQRLVGHFKERDERFVKDGRLQIRKEKILYSPNYPG